MNDETQVDGETELGRSFRRGAPEAVREVRERVERIVAFRGYRVPPEERRDLVQEVMTQTWQAVNRAGFDAEGGFWGFVEVVAARRCIDWMRTRRPETPLVADVGESAPGPLGSVLARERAERVVAALGQLRKPCRQLIRLRVALDHPYREIAAMLGKSEGALRIQMHRCIQELQRVLAERTRRGGEGEESG